ncbi:glycylpeptide N-tetradecanoyltransferase [Neophaeococcomyces mojaviensis]|uniref:Glycylpeptide N-tetradecanoyltransferase n=1 Tax=Neophaeococcomyces mojaviensis TaxID=3383035 RepID=A0ACC2ZWC3_9EURO|nr:glycylpeptide N-tetradecanoyltransferase [Knufia sp. JES_112]
MAESHPVTRPTVEDIDESESEGEAEEAVDTPAAAEHDTSAPAKKKKKKSKKAKVASALGLNPSLESTKPAAKMSDANLQKVLEANPALKSEFANSSPEDVQKTLRGMNLEQLLTGMSLTNKNQKDMASYKFWSTQPVPRLDESNSDRLKIPDGPIKEVEKDKVPQTPAPLPEGYEWVELDLTDEQELDEVHSLLNLHYVEDDKAMFRFAYSRPFLDWALKAPGWRKSWHVGVRAKGKSNLLVATIFGIPTKLRVRENVFEVAEINYLCIHKKLRSKRLAPVLIKEVTRKCYLEGVYQAIYTGGTILPTPVSTCRYYHRPLQWPKLHDVGFSPLPPKMTPSMMIKRNRVPAQTSTSGWREMEEKDVDDVLSLLSRYLKRFQLTQEFTREEIEHWFLNRQKKAEDRVVWAYVVEEAGKGTITDFASFYNLESTILGDQNPQKPKHDKIKAAYSFYYATTAAFEVKEKGLKQRVQGLMSDCLVEAKNAGFDVFNALTLLDNPLFLEELKFGAGDGQLHYYLYNWRTAPIMGGVDKKNLPDEKCRYGMGMVML